MEGKEISATDWIAIVSLGFAALGFGTAVFSVIYARNAWTSARQAILHDALINIHGDYRSAEMLDAIKSLREFYELHGPEHFVEEYEKIRTADDDELATLPKSERIDFIKNTLHYKRRLVSHFYHHLATLHVNDILPKEVLYSSWGRSDLQIIPEVLTPLEEKLRQATGSGSNPLMLRLYYDSPDGPKQLPE